MTEQDNIRDLFSKGLESHTTPVRPEIWNGLQAKMAAAGVASGSAAAVKGISVLTKWIIGGAAATAIAVTTAVLVNNTKESEKAETRSEIGSSTNSASDKQIAQNEAVTGNTVENRNSIEHQSSADNRQLVAGEENLLIDRLAEPAGSDKTKGNIGEDRISIGQGEPPITQGAVKSGSDEVIGQKTPPKPPVKEPKINEKPVIDPVDDGKTEKQISRSKIVKIPNVFTPNNDGDNDVLEVETKFVSDFSVTIMNQKSELVFKSADPDFKWDGRTMSGDEAPAGSYICVIIAKGENNETLKEYKVLQLIRK